MTKYHMRKNDDQYYVCRAMSTKNCPYSTDGMHFNTREDAEKYITKNQAMVHNTFNNVSKMPYSYINKDNMDELVQQEVTNDGQRLHPYNKNKMIVIRYVKDYVEKLKAKNVENDKTALYERVLNNTATREDYSILGDRCVYDVPSYAHIKYTYGSVMQVKIPAVVDIKHNSISSKTKYKIKTPAKIIKGRITSKTINQFTMADDYDKKAIISIIDVNTGKLYNITVDMLNNEEYEVTRKTAFPPRDSDVIIPDKNFTILSHTPWHYYVDDMRDEFLNNYHVGDKVYITSNYDFETKETNGTYIVKEFTKDKSDRINDVVFINDKTGKELKLNTYTELNPLGQYIIIKENDENTNNDENDSNFYTVQSELYKSGITLTKNTTKEGAVMSNNNPTEKQLYTEQFERDYLNGKIPYPYEGFTSNNFDDDSLELEEQQRLEALKAKEEKIKNN